MATALAWIVLVVPLISGIVLAGWPGEPPHAVTRLLGIGSILISFALSVAVFVGLLGNAADDRSFTSSAFEWISIAGTDVDLSILVDPLSVMMMLIITGVGFLIHLYSAEYMERDRDYRRFFASMNLFVFSMLLLVLAGNFFFLIVGWAFVGLASYLLIGFWYERPAAVAAAKKAFVINVIGDVGLVLAAFLILRELGTLDYGEAFAGASSLGVDSGTVLAICLLLFVGAAAKSAQVPLHTWLPDAMEGPTPVSALIHAATMVTAGVYLIVRCHAFFDLSWLAGDIVAVVGAITLLMAATVALQQVDIKRVLAWSTVSQVGYMIMAVGLGAYASGMFMLMAHAFYKAALFLAAGVVIHALHDEQSLDRMGGLRKYLRVAYFGMGAGCLAIAGVPGFAGFFAKDDVLASALNGGAIGVFCWVVGIIGAFLTALYMFRLLFRAFFGPEPAGGYQPAPHPSRWWMSVPVVVLGILSIVGGWLQLPFGWTEISDWLLPVTGEGPAIVEPTHATEVVTIIVSVVMALGGIGLAWWLFGADPERRIRLAAIARGPRAVMDDAWRFDEAYDDVFVEPGREMADVMLTRVEPAGPQGIITGTVAFVRGAARLVRSSQSGMVRAYAFWMVLGIALAGIVAALIAAGGLLMPWVSLLILVPLAAAVVLGVLPARERRAARGVALIGSLATLAISIIVVALFDRDMAVMQQVDHLDWIPAAGVSWDVGVDGISLWLVLLTTVIFTLGTIAACQRLPERRGPAFLALIMLAQAALLGLFTAGDLILFYVFWEFMLIPFALLIWNWGGDDRRGAGMIFVVYTMAGSLLMLVAIIATALTAMDATGELSFLIRDMQGVAFGEATSTLLLAGFLIAFAIKIPLWPFHGWLPRAYSQAPIVVTILLAAVMSKAGVYGLLRIGVPVFPEGIGNLLIPVAILALIGIVYGSLLAWRAPTMRLLVGYSSVAHLGFIVLGIIVIDRMAAQGAVLQMINHGIVAAAAFAVVMMISRGTGTGDMDRLGGLAKGAPRLAVAFLFVTMAALALPGSNAFVGEFFILGGVFDQYAWMAVIAMLGVIYAAVYMLRMYQGTMNGPVRGVTDDGRAAEMGARDAIILVPLILMMVWIALWPGSLVGATRASTDLALAPAQVAEGRPVEQIGVLPARAAMTPATDPAERP